MADRCYRSPGTAAPERDVVAVAHRHPMFELHRTEGETDRP